MSELHPDAARSAAKSALGYAGSFNDKGIDWHNDQPWPHRIELAQALDWVTELGAMVLNLAGRVAASEQQRDELTAEADKWKARLLHQSATEFERWEVTNEQLTLVQKQRDELLNAAEKVLAWYEAEEDHSKEPDFYRRINMCRDSELAIRAAIAKVKS